MFLFEGAGLEDRGAGRGLLEEPAPRGCGEPLRTEAEVGVARSQRA